MQLYIYDRIHVKRQDRHHELAHTESKKMTARKKVSPTLTTTERRSNSLRTNIDPHTVPIAMMCEVGGDAFPSPPFSLSVMGASCDE